jgi:hypothetical protein
MITASSLLDPPPIEADNISDNENSETNVSLSVDVPPNVRTRIRIQAALKNEPIRNVVIRYLEQGLSADEG